MSKRYKFWGWGLEDQIVGDAEAIAFGSHVAEFLGAELDTRTPPPSLDEIELGNPRIEPPSALAHLMSSDKHDRLVHTYGKSYLDCARSFEREFANAPDLVARPRNDSEVAEVLHFADRIGAAVLPYGAGSSVAGGTEAQYCEAYNGVISLDTQAMTGVREIDPVNRVARIAAGTLGPDIERGLRGHDLTLRHFPQSFEFSTLGGWIATRAAGHFATQKTHTEDFVVATRMITPAGETESLRLPSDGNGPSEPRQVAGSEGIFGVITEAWMRILPIPRHRAAVAVTFDDYFKAASAVKAIVQAGLNPANCRLVSDVETRLFNPAAGGGHKVMLGFENGDIPVDPWMNAALEIAADHGGSWDRNALAGEAGKAGEAGNWRGAFLRMPYYRESMTSLGFIFDTFSSSIGWSDFRTYHDAVKAEVEDVILRVTGRAGVVTVRFSHVYPDGPAAYFTFFAKGRQGSLSSQWREIRTAALDAVHRHGGPATHHQSIGRFHRPWFERQSSARYLDSLKAAKKAYDPRGIMNPGALFDPQPRLGSANG